MKMITNIFLICILNISCQNNQLKTNEKILSQEILSQGKGNTEKEKQQTDSLIKYSINVCSQEDRSVDPKHPPVVIDIAGSLNNIKELKLSTVASDIKYIKMEPVPDSAFHRDMKFKYSILPNYIVAVNHFGIVLYSKEGKYLRTIVKNEFTGIEVSPEYILTMRVHTFKGGGTSVYSRGNSLFYSYSNNITGEEYIMEYDCSDNQIKSKMVDPEQANIISGMGKPYVDLKHGKVAPPPPIEKKYRNGCSSRPPWAYYAELGTFMPDKNTYIKNLRGEYSMGIFSKNGDTLCKFTQFEQVKNYTKQSMRGTDFGTQYENNSNLYFRNGFNDTVFQVIPPNRLLPLYVLKLGKYKASMLQGIDPDFDLTGKIIPGDWAENQNYIFLTFAKDGYDCPLYRRGKKVKIYHALFLKSNHQLTIIKGDPYDYSSKILENDIDGGLSVWPKSYMIDNEGNILVSTKGHELKSHLLSRIYKKSTAATIKKDKLKQFALSLSDNDDVLMIVK